MIEALHHVRSLEAAAAVIAHELEAARGGLSRAEAELAQELADGEGGQTARKTITKHRGEVADLESVLRAHAEAVRIARADAEPEARAEVGDALAELRAAQDAEAVIIERAVAEMHAAALRLHVLHHQAEGRVREFSAAYPKRTGRLGAACSPRSFRALAVARLATGHRLITDMLKEDASNGE